MLAQALAQEVFDLTAVRSAQEPCEVAPPITASDSSECNLDILENLLEAPLTARPMPAPLSDLDEVLSSIFECETSDAPICCEPGSPYHSGSPFTEELDDIISEAMSNGNDAYDSHAIAVCGDRMAAHIADTEVFGLSDAQSNAVAHAAALPPPPPTSDSSAFGRVPLTLKAGNLLETGEGEIVIIRQSKSRWSRKEDMLLLRCVRHYGPRWKEIVEKHFVDRNHEALRKRWKKIVHGTSSSSFESLLSAPNI